MKAVNVFSVFGCFGLMRSIKHHSSPIILETKGLVTHMFLVKQCFFMCMSFI